VVRIRIDLSGIVQGIGFRPWVFRLAAKLGLSGHVCNSAEGVAIEVEGARAVAEQFQQMLSLCKLPGLKISSSTVRELAYSGQNHGFLIRKNVATRPPAAVLLLDTKPCCDCLRELHDPDDVRFNYPFISCCSCGPRYSIVRGLPFDRDLTTMQNFQQCRRCNVEYRTPENRRFHSQINSCPDCGPRLMSLGADLGGTVSDSELIQRAVSHLVSGRIVAIKGIGGYQLLGAAFQPHTVQRLRMIKERAKKPFAVMVRDFDAAQALARFTQDERLCIDAANNPIVLVEKRRDVSDDIRQAFEFIAPGIRRIGLMLPSSPLHVLIAEQAAIPLIVTSANLPGSPIIFRDEEIVKDLSALCSMILGHNREIVVPLDDSVVQVACEKPMVMRAGRGHAPLAMTEIFRGNFGDKIGFGAHQRNTSSLHFRGNYVLGPFIGDLGNPEVRQRAQYVRTHLQSQLGIESPLILRDYQANYASSVQASETGGQVQLIQHHLAHAFATVLEHKIVGDFTAIVWDGFGLGDDGDLWGGEFFQRCGEEVSRIGSLRGFPVYGGERMATDACLSALSLLSEACMGSEIAWLERLNIPLTREDARLHLQRRSAKSSLLKTFSAGRLIDGVCCLLGIASANSYEGQAGIMLNDRGTETRLFLPFEISVTSGGFEVDWRPLIRELLHLINQGVAVDEITGRFWNSMAKIICDIACARQVKTVLLGGGCFQGSELLRRVVRDLRALSIDVYWPQRIPPGDGGISLGQLAVSNYIESLS
jgi:hydrogenase maturation protein HypF